MCWYPVTWWYRESIVRVKQTLKGVLHRVDKCEKQIRSFESKLEESVSSTSVGSTPSRKKVQVPEEVRVRDWYMCNGFAGHTQCFFSGPLVGEIPPPPLSFEFPPQTVTNFVCFQNILHIFSPHKSNFPPKTTSLEKTLVTLSSAKSRIGFGIFDSSSLLCGCYVMGYSI